MSGEVSFEQLSLSSNDSWALLEADEAGVVDDLSVCDVVRRSDKDLCYICNQPLSEFRFPYPACDSCFICASCKEAFDPQQIPACSHTLPTDASVPMFYFANSTGEELLIMNPTHFREIPSSSCDPTDCANAESESNRAVGDRDISNPNSRSEDAGIASPSAQGLDYKSLADQVREALNLHSPPTDLNDTSGLPTELENNSLDDAQNPILGGLHPIDPDQIKRILTPKLLPQSDSVSGTNKNHNNNSSSVSPILRLSATSILRPSVQLIHGSCNSSECRSSPSSSCSRSPPSLSSSPLNIAGKVFKSVAMHSASVMNNFDCMPMDDGFDAKPVIRATPKRVLKSQPSSPPQSAVNAGIDERLANDFVTRFVWDSEKFQSLIKPRPIPKSVIEQSAYNLR